MDTIDSREKIARIDIENVLGSVEALPDQLLHAWQDASKVSVPDSYKNIKNIVMTGMGGSGLGAGVIESLFADSIKFPLVRINEYRLPEWVNEDTLVICSSYSGETEETIANAKEAIKRKAKWMAIGAGNTLIELATKHSVPYYKINPVYNPSNQPRMAIGYSVVGQIALASKAGLFAISFAEIKNVVADMRSVIEEIKVEVTRNNEAKKLARRLKEKIITFFSSRHMIGATQVVNNQLNENAKVFSATFQIPELNHHLMEGMVHPKINRSALFAIFVNSSLYPDRIQKRFVLTKDVIEKNYVETFEYKPRSRTKIGQVFEFIQFGAYVNFYLSILYRQNPAPLPWVDYFKTRLGQPLGK